MISTVGELIEELSKHDKDKPIFDLYGEPSRYHQERKIAKIFAVTESNGEVFISNAG